MKDAEPIVQILLQFTLTNRLEWRPVGSRQESYIHFHIVPPTETLNSGILQHSKQLCLHGGWKFTDFVEKESASVR
jgi:hypothetical protein